VLHIPTTNAARHWRYDHARENHWGERLVQEGITGRCGLPRSPTASGDEGRQRADAKAKQERINRGRIESHPPEFRGIL
jgi:hypothetical protein